MRVQDQLPNSCEEEEEEEEEEEWVFLGFAIWCPSRLRKSFS
jgi:hypothetical protein